MWVSLVHGLNLAAFAILMLILVPKYAALGASVAFVGGHLVGLIVAYAIAYLRFGLDITRCFIVTYSDIRFVVDEITSRKKQAS